MNRVRRHADAEGTKDRGVPLDPVARREMESAFGADFTDVRVRTDGNLGRLGARAATSGNDIAFAPGRFHPATPAGRHLLAHELAHVVQQRRGTRDGISAPGDAHEQDAARAATSVLAGGRAEVRAVASAPAVQLDQGPADTPLAEKPPILFPPPVPGPESDSDRLGRELTEAPRRPDDQPRKPGTIADAIRDLARRCEEDQRRAAESGRPVHPDTAGRMPVAVPLGEVKERVDACLETPEGKRLTEQVVELARTQEGPRVVIDWLRRTQDRVVGAAKSAGSAAWAATKTAATALARVAATVGIGVGSGVVAGVKAVGRGIAAGATAVGGALARFGKWVWGGVKTAAGATRDVAVSAAKAVGWVAGQLWDKVVGVFARVVHLFAKLPARVGRLLIGLWEGVRSLRPWALSWWASLASADTWLGLLKWLGARLVDLIDVVGVGEAYETVMDFLKFNTRTLTGAERAAAKLIFGDTIDLGLVRLDERAVIGPAFAPFLYTSFHTINGWGPTSPAILIHELTHVWQYERAGAVYMPQALHAQFFGAGYEYHRAAGLRAAAAAGRGFSGFNREQQASIVQHFSVMHQSDPDAALYAGFVAEVSSLSATQLVANLPP